MAAEPRAIATTLRLDAIATGAAVSIGIGFASSQLTTLLPSDWFQDNVQWLILMMSLLGLVADAAGGFVAGWMARTRGALHGLLSNLLAIVGGFALGIVMTSIRREGSFAYLASSQFWMQFVGWAFLGLGVATLAGYIAGVLRQRRA